MRINYMYLFLVVVVSVCFVRGVYNRKTYCTTLSFWKKN